jgi:hypothetical protein
MGSVEYLLRRDRGWEDPDCLLYSRHRGVIANDQVGCLPYVVAVGSLPYLAAEVANHLGFLDRVVVVVETGCSVQSRCVLHLVSMCLASTLDAFDLRQSHAARSFLEGCLCPS